MAYSSIFGPVGQRIEANVDFAELATAAGLLLVPIAPFGVRLDCFAIRNFGLFGVDFDLVAALEPLSHDLQVQLAHAGHHQFFGLRIAIEPEGPILLDDLVQRRRACPRRRDSWA